MVVEEAQLAIGPVADQVLVAPGFDLIVRLRPAGTQPFPEELGPAAVEALGSTVIIVAPLSIASDIS